MGLRDFCEYETIKLVRIRSVKLGSLKWSINGTILAFICIMLVWNKEYQEHDYVVSSVTAKVKGVAVTKDSDLEGVLWDVADHSGLSQGKDSFFVVTNAIVTKNQKQGSCPEVPDSGKKCRSNKDCTKGYTDQKSNGVQTGKCVDFDSSVKTCEVFAWCPIEKRRVGPKPAILGSAENFTVLIKNNIGFPNFNYTNRNILPHMNDTYLRGCIFNRTTDPYCPIFRLGDIVQEARENFTEMAIEGGVIAIQINWECNLDQLFHKCIPEYSFRRLDEKNSNKTIFPGLNFRFARNYKQNGVEERTLFKTYGIRFDVMVFGKAGKFSAVQLIIYIGSTLSYYALTTVLLDWFITTYVHPSCCSKEVKSNYTGKKYESVDLKQSPLYVSFVDEDHIAVVKGPFRKSLQEMKPAAVQVRRLHNESMRECLSLLQRPPSRSKDMEMREVRQTGENSKEHETNPPLWCRCGQCHPMPSLQEQLCCRRSAGHCISTSATFSRLVLDRQTLESVLLYRGPLLDLSQAHTSTKWLRHCAYSQYTQWRFGDVEPGSCAVIPSCSVWKIRERYPSVEGQYTGLCCEKRVLIKHDQGDK
ncbi:P2X purinoceptor 4-like isoform X1 [Acipenser ruthenus]|uniref:P2X purinoceptor 4-like isoform X1 n=2 Tax=Acipenser ruthenus TaxID=7906 RepID=UPI002742128F|nr:P2X purinoceptor 4-like isoform X1 [Acipenser ruthenus]